jgi:uncharacterized protein
MSNELVIDGISFAKKSESLQGKIAVSRLERVRDSLASSQGELTFQLDGELDAQHRANLRLSVSGQVQLTCQRCLTEFSHALTLNNRFVLVARESELPDIDEEDTDVDFLLADEKLNVQELIEDEIILSLPLAPRHGGECVKVGTGNVTDSANPFAKLAKPH